MRGSELEYGGIVEKMKKLDGQFKIRDGSRHHSLGNDGVVCLSG
jgi:hypothetical protein